MYLQSSQIQGSQYALPPRWQSAKAAVAMMGTLLVGTGSVFGFDRSENWIDYIKPRVSFVLDAESGAPEIGERVDVRTASEHIEGIRNVLNPSISELAGLFDVSRQAIYKWISGETTPDERNLRQVLTLSKIADEFELAGLSRAGVLLKMKAFNGRSLLELIKAGEDSPSDVQLLIGEAKRMEESYKISGLAQSKSKPTSDWKSSVSIPGASERA